MYNKGMEKVQEKKYYYSEIFHSIQGEGHYTGVPTAWIRFFLCNLQCNGFGQIDPTNPDTYDLPFEDFDVTTVKRVEDLPVWEKGCDSSYTWAKKFKGLMGHETPSVLAGKLIDILRNENNPEGLFLHPVTKQRQHLCFTGGEPLMASGQFATVGIYEELERQGNLPSSMTFETNGTQKIREPFAEWIKRIKEEVFFSCSPKLFTVSGEKPEKAIKPEIVAEYHQLSKFGQLKFVVGDSDREWEEMESVIDRFREVGITWPVWVMPTGAREEEQKAGAGKVAEKAFKRGYNVAARVHVYLFGNAIGT
jgi:6-pyruvoyltetrahydropterin 2'-reductase|tara:strand:- start:718 stop:1638 length:921 start_codon:yes stop_codon:yes gene_type:complete